MRHRTVVRAGVARRETVIDIAGILLLPALLVMSLVAIPMAWWQRRARRRPFGGRR